MRGTPIDISIVGKVHATKKFWILILMEEIKPVVSGKDYFESRQKLELKDFSLELSD